MAPIACEVPVAGDVPNLLEQLHSKPEALYVSTALTTWRTHEPERIARDCGVNGTVYRRLDPEYYAWLRSRMSMAKLAAKAGNLDEAAFDELRGRFNKVHEWAIVRFGEQQLSDAVRSFNAKGYQAPVAVTDVLREAAKARQRIDESASAEAMALVDAIQEKAIAFGWKAERLYAAGRRGIGSNRGLVSYLRPSDRIGEVTRYSIEIIGSPPMNVRQRFYNPDVEQPWVRRKCP